MYKKKNITKNKKFNLQKNNILIKITIFLLLVDVTIKNRVTHPRDFRDFIAIAIAD